MKLKFLGISLLLILMQSTPSLAEKGRKTPSEDGHFSAGPYYNHASKSYFELFKIPYGQQHRWLGANDRAKKLFYKNVKGRLAIVKDLATHQFILKNFKGKYIWIGLQYYCASQTLKWVDGTKVKPSDFTAWAPNWARTKVRCDNMDYMPISYTTGPTTNGISRWQASGPNKGFYLYLVEYPTGKK